MIRRLSVALRRVCYCSHITKFFCDGRATSARSSLFWYFTIQWISSSY